MADVGTALYTPRTNLLVSTKVGKNNASVTLTLMPNCPNPFGLS